MKIVSRRMQAWRARHRTSSIGRFWRLRGQQTSAIADATSMLADVIAQVRRTAERSVGSRRRRKTQAATSTASSDSGSTLGSVASTVLKSGFGLAPLISGLVGLFRRRRCAGAGAAGEVRDAGGNRFPGGGDASRAVDGCGLRPDGHGAGYAPADGNASAGECTRRMRAAPQITVNVQAMDARSFLDRSSDIALAVRDAMLNLNAINDVVNEL